MTDTTETLKPCPHCGSYNIANVHITSVNIFRVECNECGAEGGSCSSKQKAIAAWNRRSDENIVKAEALEEMANRLDAKFATQKLELTTMGWAIAELRQQAAELRRQQGG